MRLLSRWSSVVAATALVGTSLTFAVPAIAVDEENSESSTDAIEVVEGDGSQEDTGAVLEEETAVENKVEEAAVVPAAESVEGEEAEAASLPVNPSIAEVRGLADGTTVTTEGWVTASWPTGGLNGFVIQSAGTGGACELGGESDAIFVFTNHSNNVAPTPQIGDYVIVTGPLGTFSGLRQINIGPASTAQTRYEVVPPEQTRPLRPAEAITCDWPATQADRASIQSMLYMPTSEAGFAVTNTFDANTFGSLGISTTGEALWQPSDITPVVADRAGVEEFNNAHLFVLDDGSSFRFAGATGGNVANQLLVPPYVNADGSIRVGAPVEFTEPLIVDFRNSAWTLNPTERIDPTLEGVQDLPATFDGVRPDAPSDLGDLVVGGFNLENYFPTNLAQYWPGGCTSFNDNTGQPISANRCNEITVNGVTAAGPRGAWDEVNLARQTDRIVNTILGMDPAALGVMELENSYKLSFGDPSKADASAKYLVKQLNKVAGAGTWAYISPNPDNQEAIEYQDVMYPGIIYQPAKVTPLEGGQLTLSDQSAPGQAFSNARAPFGQAFEPTDGGKPFFLVANHFKSKSCSGATGDETDQGDGESCWNPSRVAQATAVAEWANGPALDELKEKTGVDVEDVILVGDFNAYTFEQPMLAFYDAGFDNINLGADGLPENSSYSFSGLNGSLDHVLISASAEERATGHAIWNTNAPEQIGLGYSRFNATGGDFVQQMVGTPFRASDHDPAIVGLEAGRAPDTTELTLLNINDFHGRIVGTLNGDQTALVNQDDFTTVKFGYTVESLRNAAGADNSLFLSAGDNVGGTLFASAVQQDVPTIDLLNALGLDATAVGNHEFDAGWNDLNVRLQDLFDGPLIAANVFDRETGDPVLPEYAMFEVAGLKVAVTGAVTQDTLTLVNPEHVASLTFGDPVDGVNRVVADLEALPADQRPDIIVAEYHEGAATGSPASTIQEQIDSVPMFARMVLDTDPAVDAIFNGHTHQTYAWDAPIPGEEGQTRPIVSTGSFGANIGKVVLTVGLEDGDVRSYTAENVNTVAYTRGLTNEQMVQSPVMDEVYDITLRALKVADAEGNKPTGQMTAAISRDYTQGEYVDGAWTMTAGSENGRNNESPLGKLVGNMLVEGQMSELQDAPDFGVTNPGGLRANLNYSGKGIITVQMARDVLPFNNDLSIAKLTGEQVIQMLEEQWQRDANGNVPSRPFLQLGLSDNVTYTYHEIDDPNLAGQKLGVVDSVTINGEPIDLEKVYNVGTFSFLAAGGDNFHAFAGAQEVINTGLVDWQSWLAYLSNSSGEYDPESGTYSTPIAPDFARQSVWVEGLPEGDLVPGNEYTVTFKNMNIHAVGAPANTELTLELEGVTVGTAAVTTTQLENGNWTDSATVTFTVPATFSGEGSLVANVAPTNTVVTIPVTAGDTPPVGDVDVRRLFGSTRFGTNVAVNDAVAPAKGGVVFVASGAGFADALSAAPAASAVDGSLFLTPKDRMPASTLEAIKALSPSKVYIVGGSGAVSTTVATQLRGATQVLPIRLGGANRYDTNAKVLTAFFTNADVDSAFVATGTNFPDAISAAAAGGTLGAPVVLVKGASATQMLPEAQRVLTRSGVDTILIAGGTGAVGSTLETNLGKSFDTVIRLSGSTRYSTNLAVNDYVTAQVGDTAVLQQVWVATGVNFPDALSAAVPAGKLTDRLVLSNGKCIPSPVVSQWIKGPDSQVNQVTLVGGTGALSQAVENLTQCG